jgi:hypothetical protein
MQLLTTGDEGGDVVFFHTDDRNSKKMIYNQCVLDSTCLHERYMGSE